MPINARTMTSPPLFAGTLHRPWPKHCEMVHPVSLAVLRLIASSSFVGRSTASARRWRQGALALPGRGVLARRTRRGRASLASTPRRKAPGFSHRRSRRCNQRARACSTAAPEQERKAPKAWRRARIQRLRISYSRLAPHGSRLAYRITLSARASTLGGIVRPISFAVFRLITNSSFVGRSTGSSPALAPLAILSMSRAASWATCESLAP